MPPIDNNTDAQALSSLLTAKPLQQLLRGAKQQQALQRLLSEVIPESICKNITSWNIEDQKMVIKVPSASWATRLRAYQNDLLYATDRHPMLGKLNAVKITVQNVPQRKQINQNKRHTPAERPSQQAMDMVKATADNCQHHALKAALGNLLEKMQHYRKE